MTEKYFPGWKTEKGPQASNKSGFRATGHRLLLLGQQQDDYAKTESGIILTAKTQDQEQQHQV